MSMPTADELFVTVEGEAKRFTSASVLTVEDVRQSLYLFCLEHAQGVDGYNPLLGDPRTFIMGRMWGLLERWRGREVSLHEVLDDEMAVPVPLALRCQSVASELIERERRRVMEAVLADQDDFHRPDRRDLSAVLAVICGSGVAAREMERQCGGGSRARGRWREARRQHEARFGLTSGLTSTGDQP